MQAVDLWLLKFLSNLTRRQQARECLLGPADTRGTGPHDDTNPIRTYTICELRNTLQQAVLLQTKPGQLVVATEQMIQVRGQRYVLNSIHSADPRVDITVLQVVAAQSRLPVVDRVLQCLQTDAGGRRCRISSNR